MVSSFSLPTNFLKDTASLFPNLAYDFQQKNRRPVESPESFTVPKVNSPHAYHHQQRVYQYGNSAEYGGDFYEKYLRDLDPTVRRMLDNPTMSMMYFTNPYKGNYPEIRDYETYKQLVREMQRGANAQAEHWFQQYVNYVTDFVRGFQEYTGIEDPYELENMLRTYLDIAHDGNKEGRSNRLMGILNPGEGLTGLTRQRAGQPISMQDLINLVNDQVTKTGFRYGLDMSDQEAFDFWLDRYAWNMKPGDIEDARNLFSRVQEEYRRDLEDGRHVGTFLQYLNYHSNADGTNRYLNRERLAGLPGLMSFIQSRDNRLGAVPSDGEGPNPDISNYIDWIRSQPGLSVNERRQLETRFEHLYNQYQREARENPFRYASFLSYLNTVDPHRELMYLPEPDLSETYNRWVAQQRGLTPEQRAALEARFEPTVSRYLGQRDYVTEPMRFMEFLATQDPFGLIGNVPRSAPFAGDRTFGSRLRWMGY